jgi:hypothetical protein
MGALLLLAIAGFLVSRFVFRSVIGFAPDPEVIGGHWQHTSLVWLHDDFWETLYYLHAQPPGWNALIGALTGLVGPDAERVADAIVLLFSALGIAMMLVMIGLARRAGLAPPAAVAFGLVFALSPTMLYYELYPFYPHLTAFLVTLMLAGFVLADGDGVAPLVGAFAAAAGLCWIWAAFNPAFVLLLAVLALVLYPQARRRVAVASMAVALAVSAAPTLKNKVVLGGEFASSWTGMNLTQTLPDLDPDLRKPCRFRTVAAALKSGEGLPGVEVEPVGIVSVDAMTKPENGEPNMNNLLVSKRAEACLAIYLERAAADPWSIVVNLAKRIVVTHTVPTVVYYGGRGVEGWDAEVWIMRLYYRLGPVAQAATALPYVLLLGYGLWRLRRAEGRAPLAMALGVIVYVTLVTHVANGVEQQRMRVSIEPLYWFLVLLAFADLVGRWASSEPAPDPSAPDPSTTHTGIAPGTSRAGRR